MEIQNFTDEMDPTWYQMVLFLNSDIEQNPHRSDLFEACVIRAVSGRLQDDDDSSFSYPRHLDLTGRAMVGLNVIDVDWIQEFQIPTDELEKMHFKLKIYACDELNDYYNE